jgi:hypothetical protein
MKVLGLLGTALLPVASPGYTDRSDPGQAVPAQPDSAVLMQKIRDLEDQVIALEGQIRQLKTEPAPPTQPATTAVPNAESGTQAAGPCGKPSLHPPPRLRVEPRRSCWAGPGAAPQTLR